MTKIPGLPDQPLRMNNTCSLILRLWQIDNSTSHNWRASLEIPEDGKRFGFSSLEQLFAFLIDFTEINCDAQLIGGKENMINK